MVDQQEVENAKKDLEQHRKGSGRAHGMIKRMVFRCARASELPELTSQGWGPGDCNGMVQSQVTYSIREKDEKGDGWEHEIRGFLLCRSEWCDSKEVAEPAKDAPAKTTTAIAGTLIDERANPIRVTGSP